MRRLVLDLETTGTNPNKHSILSIGIEIIEVKKNRVTRLGEAEYFIQPYKPEVSVEAMSINGINLDYHKQIAADPSTILQMFTSFVQHFFPKEPATVVGHNVDFDLAFLRELFETTEFPKEYNSVVSYRKIDTQTIVRFFQDAGHFPKDLGGLQNWLTYFGVEYESKYMHGALYDAKRTTDLYEKLLTYGEKLLENFNDVKSV